MKFLTSFDGNRVERRACGNRVAQSDGHVGFVCSGFAARLRALMNKLFSRWLPCATLAAWSAILLYFYFSGRITAFLHPMFRPYILVAGLVLAGMAVVFVLLPSEAECCTTAECGHPFSRLASGKALTFLVLLLPLSVAALLSPDSFGKTTIQNRGMITDAAALPAPPPKATVSKPAAEAIPAKAVSNSPPPATTPAAPSPSPGDYLQRTPEGHIVAEVLDLLYAAQDSVLRKDFEGQTVELVGQLMPDPSNTANIKRFKAVRMFMTCCAADARPVATLVECEKLPDFPEMTWVKVTGTSTFPTENGRRTAVLMAAKVEKSDPPEETMLY
jgi:uncharacterized repeat protein (TIGR03943 family)